MALTRLIPLRLIRPIPRLGGLRARHLRDRSRGRLRGMLNRLPKWVCPVHRRKLLKAKCPRGKPLPQLRLKARRPMERPRPRLGGSPRPGAPGASHLVRCASRPSALWSAPGRAPQGQAFQGQVPSAAATQGPAPYGAPPACVWVGTSRPGVPGASPLGRCAPRPDALRSAPGCVWVGTSRPGVPGASPLGRCAPRPDALWSAPGRVWVGSPQWVSACLSHGRTCP